MWWAVSLSFGLAVLAVSPLLPQPTGRLIGLCVAASLFVIAGVAALPGVVLF